MPQFSLIPGILIREEDFGGLAFVRATGATLRLSPSAYSELNNLRCNGAIRTIAEDDDKRLRFYHRLCRFGVMQEVANNETS